MDPDPSLVVRCADGRSGVLEPADAGASGGPTRVVRLEGGRRVVVPSELLVARESGGYDLAVGLDEINDGGGEVVIPVVEEQTEASKRVVETGRVRVTKSVSERVEVVDPVLTREEVEVERVAVGRYVDGPLGTRQEGDTLVIPLMEEVFVVEKRWLVREEIRLTRRRTEGHSPQEVTLRREAATVERVPAPGPAADGGVKSGVVKNS